MRDAYCRVWLVFLVCIGLFSGCTTTHFSVWEKLGYQKREILQSRVERARDHFQVALDNFGLLASASEPLTAQGASASDVASWLQVLRGAYRRALKSASTLSAQIQQVDDVGMALFDEWEAEIDNTASSAQRSADQQELADTRRAYNVLIGSMRRSEVGVSPVLTAVEDSMRSLDAESAQGVDNPGSGFLSLQGDLERLSGEFRRSIGLADEFANSLNR